MSKQRLGDPMPIPLSAGWRAGDFVFTSGQVGTDDQGKLVGNTIEEQTRQVIKRIEGILAKAGCSLKDVVKTTVWLEDRSEFQRFNAIYKEFFPQDPPARSTVEAKLMIDAKIEIEAIAYKPLDK
jgi:2-iminobutanoate/2-iminopropanoate deaminase